MVYRYFFATFFLVTIFFTATPLCSTDKTSPPDIQNPGPDTANFPTSPFTLPKGRCYFENFPVAIDTEGNKTPFTYNWPFLLRIGIADRIELRIASQGITKISAINTKKAISGFSPLIFGFKTHLWGTKEDLWIPSGGIEMFVVTPMASDTLSNGSQFIVNALFKHTFPDDITLEWNAAMGLSHYTRFQNADNVFGVVTWSLTKCFSPKFEAFFQGLYASSQYPLYPKLFFLGIGLQSNITQRVSIYGNFNWSVFHNTNPYLLNIGFAVAF